MRFGNGCSWRLGLALLPGSCGSATASTSSCISRSLSRYAAWTTGNVIVEYLVTHTNQWPRSWEDLRSATNSMLESGKPGVYTPLDRLPEFVKVDWDIDMTRLLQAARSNSTAKVHVISRLDGSPLSAVWGRDTEPNTKVMGYLRWSLMTSNDQSRANGRQPVGSETNQTSAAAASRRSP